HQRTMTVATAAYTAARLPATGPPATAPAIPPLTVPSTNRALGERRRRLTGPDAIAPDAIAPLERPRVRSADRTAEASRCRQRDCTARRRSIEITTAALASTAMSSASTTSSQVPPEVSRRARRANRRARWPPGPVPYRVATR